MIDQQRNGFPGSVGRFFFMPTDPSVLGFMRIMTGLLLLYVHGVGYSLDMKDFFGPHAWWDQQAANPYRRDYPTSPTNLGWQETKIYIRLDDVPRRRAAAIEFLQNLPVDVEERRTKLRYLKYLIELSKAGTPESNQDYSDGFRLSNSAARLFDLEHQGALVRKALEAKDVPETGSPVFIPNFLRRLPPEERLAVWNDVLAFNAYLPADSEKQEFVLRWLNTYGYGTDRPYDWRIDLWNFLVGEKKDEEGRDRSLPSQTELRTEFLRFMETWGGDPRLVRYKGLPIFSQWFHITDPATMWCVHICACVVFLLFTIGLWTRVTSVLTWAITLSYIHRSQMILFGQDTMQTILVTYLMIGPCGATMSLDSLRKRYRAARALLGGGGKPVPWAESVLAGPRATWLANFAIRLFQINYCFIYASSGLSKLKGSTWWDHSAPWLVAVNPEFGLIRYRLIEWLIRAMSESRMVIAVTTGALSMFTLVMEVGLPLLIWTRLRPLMVIGSIMLHLGIAIMMGLAVFSLYMFTLVLCYIPAKLIRDRVTWQPGAAGTSRKMTVRYDSRDRAAVRKAALMRALDLAQQITFTDIAAKGTPSATVELIDPDGKQSTGEDLFHAALRELVFVRSLRFLGYIPGVWGGVNALFNR